MGKEALTANQPNLADHPMFSENPQTMEEVAGRVQLEDRQTALHKDLGIDSRKLEAERIAHEKHETESRKAWNEFGAVAVKKSVETPETPEDPLL